MYFALMRHIFRRIIKDISQMKLSSKIFAISPVCLVLLTSMVQAQTSAPTETKETVSSAPLTVIKKTTEVSNIKRTDRNRIDTAHRISESDKATIEKSNTTKDEQKPKKTFTGSV
ncbi:hypothetical protein [Arsukibacterium indicum]|uniref:Uncharacterized protein n=1 Tax=Arsukibacterium indicum TaxID=2848612 RepID=A0ABS6MQK3_9GAMM|nr:hypothetical protein [Arsukibacterium indicum]MBV2131092.1 hypothetical protein [Arsukibacterium indicum]